MITNLLIPSNGLLCDQCAKGPLTLLRKGQYRSTSGITITSVPFFYCRVCKQRSYDLQLLIEMEEALQRLQVPFRHLDITQPS